MLSANRPRSSIIPRFRSTHSNSNTGSLGDTRLTNDARVIYLCETGHFVIRDPDLLVLPNPFWVAIDHLGVPTSEEGIPYNGSPIFIPTGPSPYATVFSHLFTLKISPALLLAISDPVLALYRPKPWVGSNEVIDMFENMFYFQCGLYIKPGTKVLDLRRPFNAGFRFENYPPTVPFPPGSIPNCRTEGPWHLSRVQYGHFVLQYAHPDPALRLGAINTVHDGLGEHVARKPFLSRVINFETGEPLDFSNLFFHYPLPDPTVSITYCCCRICKTDTIGLVNVELVSEVTQEGEDTVFEKWSPGEEPAPVYLAQESAADEISFDDEPVNPERAFIPAHPDPEGEGEVELLTNSHDHHQLGGPSRLKAGPLDTSDTLTDCHITKLSAFHRVQNQVMQQFQQAMHEALAKKIEDIERRSTEDIAAILIRMEDEKATAQKELDQNLAGFLATTQSQSTLYGSLLGFAQGKGNWDDSTFNDLDRGANRLPATISLGPFESGSSPEVDNDTSPINDKNITPALEESSVSSSHNSWLRSAKPDRPTSLMHESNIEDCLPSENETRSPSNFIDDSDDRTDISARPTKRRRTASRSAGSCSPSTSQQFSKSSTISIDKTEFDSASTPSSTTDSMSVNTPDSRLVQMPTQFTEMVGDMGFVNAHPTAGSRPCIQIQDEETSAGNTKEIARPDRQSWNRITTGLGLYWSDE